MIYLGGRSTDTEALAMMNAAGLRRPLITFFYTNTEAKLARLVDASTKLNPKQESSNGNEKQTGL